MHERKRGVDVFCWMTLAPGRARWRLRRPPPRLEVRTVYRGRGRMLEARFAPGCPREREFIRLLAQCGPACRQFLWAEDFPAGRMPEVLLARRHRPDAYRREWMLRTAIRCLELSRLPLPRRTAILYDPEGAYADCAERMLPYAAWLKVVTGHPERYRQTEERMMELYGAPLLVTGDPAALTTGCLVLAPGQQPAWDARLPPVFGAGRVVHAGSVGEYQPDTTGFELPAGIDPLAFLSAAWQLEGIEEALRPPLSVVYAGGRCTLERVAGAMRVHGMGAG